VRAWQLVDDLDERRSASENMGRDLELLRCIGEGEPPALRLYGWSPPALSIGRFQDDAEVDRAACEHLGVDVVRRPTGGRALLHGGDLTYTVVMPRPPGAAGSVEAVYTWIAGRLTAGLATIGVTGAVARTDGPAGPVCFAGQQGADLRVGDRKLCGSAQRNRDDSVLQHGSILLRRLPFDETDLLVGEHDRARLRAVTVTLEELGAPCEARAVADAVVDGFREALDVSTLVG
jgi:lipoate-protein ligase A